MSYTSPILIDTDAFSENGKIYLVTNKTFGNRVLLPLPKNNFIQFLEKIFRELEIDDYDISSRVLSNPSFKHQLVPTLVSIFKTDYFDFALNNSTKSNNEFFDNLNQLFFYHLNMKELLKTYHLVQNNSNKQTTKNIPIESSIILSKDYPKETKISDKNNNQILVTNIGTKYQRPFDLRDDIISGRATVPVKETKETNGPILPYNDFDNSNIRDNETIAPFCENTNTTMECMPVSYYTWKAEDANEQISKELFKSSILYSYSLNIGIVIEKEDVQYVNYLVENFKDFELIKNYNKLNKKEMDDIRSYFHKRDFDTIELIKNKISSFETLFDIEKECSSKDNTTLEIEYYLKYNYQIDNEPKNIMKASVILDAVLNDLRITCNDRLKLSKDISSILLKMGLKKKRLADGIYYYGIVAKPSLINSDENTEERFKKVLEEHKLNSVSYNLSSLPKN